MTDREIMKNYMKFLRVESNSRVSLIPGTDMEMPFFIYDGAHNAAKKDTISNLNLEDEEKYNNLFDNIYSYFRNKLKETDHFADSDDLTEKAIDNGEFD